MWVEQVFEEFFLFKLGIPCRGAVRFAIWCFRFALGSRTTFVVIIITTTTLSKSLNTVVTVFIDYIGMSLKEFEDFIRLSHVKAIRHAKAPTGARGLWFAGGCWTTINYECRCTALNKCVEAFVFLNFFAEATNLATFNTLSCLCYAFVSITAFSVSSTCIRNACAVACFIINWKGSRGTECLE